MITFPHKQVIKLKALRTRQVRCSESYQYDILFYISGGLDLRLGC